MIREKGIEEIYDGHFYRPEDMVPVGVSDCAGCSDCCRSTGDSIILDPWDMFLLGRGTGKSFTDMIEREIEIRLVDGLILPNLMQHREGPAERGHRPLSADRGLQEQAQHREGPSEDRCPFLSDAGRCSIHPFRPGLCRLYPMGRFYTEDGFYYICQKDECTGREKTPVLLREWIGIDDLERYEAFVLDWHRFQRQAAGAMEKLTPKSRDSVRRYILQLFFVHPYLQELDFYPQYAARMEVCREALQAIL